MLRHILITGLYLCASVSVASATSDLSSLKEKLSHVKAMEADFTQNTTHADGTPLQTISGHVKIKKPGLFHWAVEEPELNLIISDGEKVWNYDEALEQVTVQYLEKASGTPVFFLSGDVESLGKDFLVKLSDNKKRQCSQAVECFELYPHQADSPFQWIRLGFDDSLKELHILDQLGQVSHFYFENVKTNSMLAQSIFQFTPPNGVDVIGP